MRTQVAIVGGGPAGSACAIRLAMAGIQPVIIEKDDFPRFHIGESLTGESGNLLREMGLEQEMLQMRNPVKLGVQIYSPHGRHWYWFPVKRRDQEDGLQDTFTWQVRRSDFDKLLLDHALKLGATLVKGKANKPLVDADGTATGVAVELPDGSITEIESDVLVDASGQQTFLCNTGLTGRKLRGHYDRQVAVYSHFRGAIRDPGEHAGNTVLFFRKAGHWAWFIPIDDEVTSIGFVVSADYFQQHKQSRTEFVERELREFNRALAQRVATAERIDEVRGSSNYSYEIERFSGRGWVCIGDAHRFLDPLFSFGVNVALAEAKAAAAGIAKVLAGEVDDEQRPFQEFETWSNRGVDVCQTALDGFSFASLTFGTLMREHEDDFIDMLAGRVWDDPVYHSLRELRRTLSSRPEAAPVTTDR